MKKNETTQEKIISVAELLFAQHGFDNTTMQMIADNVGIQKASLYHHFKTKEDIYLYIFTAVIASVVKIFQDENTDFKKQLVQMFQISAESGRVLFSAQKISADAYKQLGMLGSSLEVVMKKYIQKQDIKISTNDALRIIMDTTQAYARNHALGLCKAMTPEKYGSLVYKLLIK